MFMQGMEFYGYHGVFPEENKLGQKFIVDLTISMDLKKAGETDDLTFSINYGELYECCRGIVEDTVYELIEAVAEKIAQKIIVTFPLALECTVKVIKPNPPIKGHYHSAAVEITRGRET